MTAREIVEWDNEDAIRALLLGRTVVRVDGESLKLDDGCILRIHANHGCGGCSSGWYELTELNECPTNAIMAVEFEDEDVGYDIDDENPQRYRVFVLAEDRRVKLLEVVGDDGNGYYGTGYWIEVLRGGPGGQR